MRKLFAMTVAVSVLSLNSASFGHLPEGLTLGVWQWPTSHLPVMDGNLGEWETVPTNLWITPFSEFDGNLLINATRGEEGRDVDLSDLNFRFTVAWNDELDRLYFAYDRFDDVWDRDDADSGTDLGGGDDSIEIHIDADHGAEIMWFGGDAFDTPEERTRNNGRFLHASHYRWPKLSNWNWMWASSSTWHDVEPYSCCEDSFTLEGEHGTEANVAAEWWTVAWNDFDHGDPDNSVQHDFQEGQTVGLGVGFLDNDLGTEEGAGSLSAAWRLGAQCVVTDGSCATDFRLLAVDEDRLATAVENDSWGHIKASYMR